MNGGALTLHALVEDLSPLIISRAGFYLYGHSTTPHSHCQHHQQQKEHRHRHRSLSSPIYLEN